MRHWWNRYFTTPAELEAKGVVGINMRNARFVLPNNPRRLYDLVDNKIRAKGLAQQRGIAVPETYAIVHSPKEIRRLHRMLGEQDSFVVKPARGSGGKGILVISSKEGDRFVKPSGAMVTREELRFHMQNIIAGLYSLAGKRDVGLVEYRVKPARIMTELSFQGAPDVRVVIYKGYPVMAMLRASTRESDGRSNLHQGALGIGVDIATGRTVHAVHHGRSITVHPDLKVPLIGVQLPEWDRILEIAVTCQQMTGLGYLGVDMMIDEERGPMMIEVNARPGLAIQLANGVGLLKRLKPAEDQAEQHPHQELGERIAFSRNAFAVRPAEV